MKSKPPLAYLRRCDHRYTAVVSLPSGRRARRRTGCKDREAAQQYAELWQAHIRRHSADGKLFPSQCH